MEQSNNRYHRQILLPEIGIEGQNRLYRSKVLVIGAGGLGCPVLQYLAGAGVGTIGIIDFDSVELSNLHRQVLFGEADLGRNKAEAASDRLRELNSDISVHVYPEALTAKNALSLVSEYDIIVDGSDNFPTRYLVNDACVVQGKPWVYGAIFKFQGQVSVFNYDQGPTYRCMFPTPPKPGEVPSCSEAGVLGVLPGMMGTLMANEVLKMILGSDDILSGDMVVFDQKTVQSNKYRISRNDNAIKELLNSTADFENRNYKAFCGEEEVNLIETEAALERDGMYIIDGRESVSFLVRVKQLLNFQG